MGTFLKAFWADKERRTVVLVQPITKPSVLDKQTNAHYVVAEVVGFRGDPTNQYHRGEMVKLDARSLMSV